MDSAAPDASSRRGIWLGVLLLALVGFRVLYHADYLLSSPFAKVTLSDGQVYEDAARDILAHPPWGSEPFFLQGLYAYVLALGMAYAPAPILGLCVQLALSALGLLFVYGALRATFGLVPARSAMCLLLAYPMLWFYENKYLSCSLGIACNALALWAMSRVVRLGRVRDALLLGVGLAASVLGRPNMLLAIPFALAGLALWATSRSRAGVPTRRSTSALLLAAACGTVLGLAPMALRNAVVVGAPHILPSHGGGIPFFIGNNPDAEGLWNTGGGMLTGQVAFERAELQQKLGLSALRGGALDRAIGDAMYARAMAFAKSDPIGFLGLVGKKLALCFGNAEYAHDYDPRGEAEMLGAAFHVGVPFGVLLGLGVLGLLLLAAPKSGPGDAARMRALCLFLAGQVAAVVAANVLYFHAAQHRVPLAVPLAFASAAAFAALARPAEAAALLARHRAACAFAIAMSAQAFVPRVPAPPRAITAAHHANLAAAWDALGDSERAASAYAAAIAKSPKQAILHFRQGLVLARLGRRLEAMVAFERARGLSPRDALIRDASAHEITRLKGHD